MAYAIIISIAEIDYDAFYISYRKFNMIRPIDRTLLQQTGIILFNGAGIPELVRFQEHFRDNMITVYQGEACEVNVRRAGRLQ